MLVLGIDGKGHHLDFSFRGFRLIRTLKGATQKTKKEKGLEKSFNFSFVRIFGQPLGGKIPWAVWMGASVPRSH